MGKKPAIGPSINNEDNPNPETLDLRFHQIIPSIYPKEAIIGGEF